MQSSMPVPPSERAQILDVLRGFALFGILLDNIIGFSGWGFISQPEREAIATWPADGILGMLELAFVKGKFYSLFSLLFGIGFSIILIRNEQRDINPLKIFYRRLTVLFLIGAAHLFFLWEGDIVMLYAMLGLLLPLFRKCSDKALVIWALALILSPILIDVVKVLLNVQTGRFLLAMGENLDKKHGVPLGAAASQYLYSSGAGWHEWRNWQLTGFFYRYSDLIESNRLPKVLGMFLLGFYAGRKFIYSNLENNVRLLKTLRKWGFIVGIPANLAMAFFFIDGKDIPNIMGLFDTISYAFGVVPLSLAYVSTICLMFLKNKESKRWKTLAPVGRMALTNYLMQTILCITIFYGVGFGLGGNKGLAVVFPIALLIYIFQVLYSNWWFKYFNYGPFEWLWRQLTYGKRLPLRKKYSLPV